MAVSLQVIYPVGADTTFDFDYYLGTHFDLVGEHMGPHIAGTVVTKGVAGGPDVAAGYHAIATITFADQDAFNAAMAASGPVMADVPNFTNAQPDVLIGEVVG
ncbi:EthD family reductase [Shimia sp.]|uniref:EthD family reductase n=1 Tax=Shimia sp. TaxID=1954381 RepID=UPI003297168B